VRLTTGFHLVPRLRLRGTIPPLLRTSSWCDAWSSSGTQGQLYLRLVTSLPTDQAAACELLVWPYLTLHLLYLPRMRRCECSHISYREERICFFYSRPPLSPCFLSPSLLSVICVFSYPLPLPALPLNAKRGKCKGKVVTVLFIN